MKVYLVGGAVRDNLLGYPVKERDWLVVGAVPEQLLSQGYRQVGRHFPVFLHPDTGEEYALARTESKSAPGYYGFNCNYNINVTLEEDLLRRDLTINAMAIDEFGKIIDPYRGLDDIKLKKLRHISAAFADDPVRVLRVARFAARYHHLGFHIDDDTMHLMYLMTKRGELDYLIPERIWSEWYKSLFEKNPEMFIQVLRDCGALAVIIPEIDRLFGVPNSYKYHPEIDSGVHTLCTLQATTKLSGIDEKFVGLVRFAAALHDVGKGITSMKQWPRHHGHEYSGVAIIDEICQRLRVPVSYRQFAIQACRYHLIMHRVLELNPCAIVNTLNKIDAFRRPAIFAALLNVCEADAHQQESYKQREIWNSIYKRCSLILASDAIKNGCAGAEIQDYLYKRRVQTVSDFLP